MRTDGRLQFWGNAPLEPFVGVYNVDGERQWRLDVGDGIPDGTERIMGLTREGRMILRQTDDAENSRTYYLVSPTGDMQEANELFVDIDQVMADAMVCYDFVGGFIVNGWNLQYDYIAVIDEAFNILWEETSKRPGGTMRTNYAVYAADAFYAVGAASSNEKGLSGGGIMKLSEEGELLWRDVHKINSNYRFKDMAVTNNEDILALGANLYGGIIVRYDTEGNVIKEQRYREFSILARDTWVRMLRFNAIEPLGNKFVVNGRFPCKYNENWYNLLLLLNDDLEVEGFIPTIAIDFPFVTSHPEWGTYFCANMRQENGETLGYFMKLTEEDFLPIEEFPEYAAYMQEVHKTHFVN